MLVPTWLTDVTDPLVAVKLLEPKVPVKKGDALAVAASGRLPCLDLAKLREQAIREALQVTRGHKARAAKLLGVHANTMTRLLKEIDGGVDSGTDTDSDG